MLLSKIGVLMSVVGSERREYLESSVDSIFGQAYSGEVVLYLAVDGNPSAAVADYVENLSLRENVFLCVDGDRKGLAYRLNQLIDLAMADPEVSFFARMDSDDISLSSRFASQVAFLEKNVSVDVLGSSVVEIDSSGVPRAIKLMDENDVDIKSSIISRCPFNHPSVMFRRRVFEDGCRYDSSLMNTQDYFLWVSLCEKKYIFANISDPLLYFRVGDDFFSKRGVGKAFNDFRAKFYAMRRLRMFSVRNVCYAFAILVIRLSPRFFQRIVYRHFRRGVSNYG